MLLFLKMRQYFGSENLRYLPLVMSSTRACWVNECHKRRVTRWPRPFVYLEGVGSVAVSLTEAKHRVRTKLFLFFFFCFLRVGGWHLSWLMLDWLWGTFFWMELFFLKDLSKAVFLLWTIFFGEWVGGGGLCPPYTFTSIHELKGDSSFW